MSSADEALSWLDLLDQLWSRNDMSEKEASKLAVEAQHLTRPATSGSRRR